MSEPRLKLPPDGDLFVHTAASAKVIDRLQLMEEERVSVVIKGQAGCGKTAGALYWLHATSTNALYCKLEPRQGSLRWLLETLAGWYRVPHTYRSMNDLIDIVIEGVARHGGPDGDVLIFDEAQNLTLEAMRLLVDLRETCGIPVALIGNEDVLKRSKGATWNLDQIEDRALPPIEIVSSDRDTALIAPEFLESDALDLAIAFSRGKTTRKSCEAMRSALRRAAPAERASLEHLEEAILEIWGLDEHKKLMRQVRKPGRRSAA